ncbi:amidase family protein [Caulobacter sp. KR2-114]|uniref:amidase family protein n=1 Tax=Caulobacter sp. KR2-114 TaxID=3400912 RepID=UPI003C119605
MAEFFDLDATAQLAILESRRVSAADLLEATLARHAQVNGRLNAVVAQDLERARERARAMDDRRAKGDPMGPLAGLPMTIKDTFDVEGMPASSGLDVLRRRRARDAAAVGHIKRAGAVVWGKTNTPVMAGDWQTFNALYGTTNNPWDLERTCGGSSGGAAAALASGMTALELGSDIGGSLRVPASFCGVFSHKPTWGLVSQIGHVPPAPGAHAERDLNVVGPMARSARDLRLLLSVIENGPLAAKAPPAELRGLKVGLWTEEPAFLLDPDVRGVVEGFGEALRTLGVDVRPIKSPVDAPRLLAAYQVLLGALVGTDLEPTQRRRLERLRGPAKLARAFGLSPGGWPDLTLAYTASHAEWIEANETRALLGDQISDAFTAFDVIIAPVAPVAAFPHDHRPFQKRILRASDGTQMPYTAMLRWIALATALGLPATAMPAGRSAEGLPVGVQIIGPRGADSRCLSIAEALEERLGGFERPPALETH